MPAHSDEFPWESYYGHFEYFESRVTKHRKVRSLSKSDDGVYSIERTFGDVLRVFVCECYAYGIAEYHETTQRINQVDAIIINSTWCRYTDDAKYECFQDKTGLYEIPEFLAALNRQEFWSYMTIDQKRHFQQKGLI